MYEGSMYGAGSVVFAVWGYVIAHTRNSRVELNPRKLADTLGDSVGNIRLAIEKLMAPDPESRHKAQDGRRLLKEGEFQYFVPSWAAYAVIMSEEARRDYNRRFVAAKRAKKNLAPVCDIPNVTTTRHYERTLENEGRDAADKLM